MINKNAYLDKFRVIAAILVIAIHTYPLSSINENLDFAFTHIICRIAVPYFLLITGFFVLPKAMNNRNLLINYTFKIIKMYAICIILYLPINIYSGKLNSFNFVEILKDILINGTFYHLWYFPAILLGIWITYFALKVFGKKKSLILFIFLFIIGLFGDSYYGISKEFVITRKVYNLIFNIFDYTRNGLFFAPIFIYLGYFVSFKKLNISKIHYLLLMVVFLCLMVIEGLILNRLNLQKHDSMYIMLVPACLCLFNFLVQNSTGDNKMLRNLSTTIYILHPMFIILVRGIAKVLNLQDIMIDNSLIHYLLVVVLTITFSFMKEKIVERVKKEKWKKIDI